MARRQRHHTGKNGENFCCFPWAVDIPDTGPAQNRAGRAPQSLKNPPQDEGFDIAGQGTAGTGQGKQDKAANHHRLATETVGQGTAYQLGQSKSGHVQAQGQLYLVCAGSEIPTDLWQ